MTKKPNFLIFTILKLSQQLIFISLIITLIWNLIYPDDALSIAVRYVSLILGLMCYIGLNIFYTKYKENFLKKPNIIKNTELVMIMLISLLVIKSLIIEQFRVPSSSMMPTILPGDLVLVNKLKYQLNIMGKKIQLSEPQYFDTVVFKKNNDKQNTLFVKRVIGKENDTITYLLNTKRLYINDVLINEEWENFYELPSHHLIKEQLEQENMNVYVNKNKNYRILKNHVDDIEQLDKLLLLSENLKELEKCEIKKELIQCKVPKDRYFVMGDNRDNSIDSRHWGFVKKENIIGEAIMVITNNIINGRFLVKVK